MTMKLRLMAEVVSDDQSTALVPASILAVTQTSAPATNWIDLLTFTNTAPATNFVDTSATNFNRRFYRVVSP